MADRDIADIVPAQDLSQEHLNVVFAHFHYRLAAFRAASQHYSESEYRHSSAPAQHRASVRHRYDAEMQRWAQNLLEEAYAFCGTPGKKCPPLSLIPSEDTNDMPGFPSTDNLKRILNGILMLHVTQSKEYSAKTRAFLHSLGPVDESAVVRTLKNPEQAMKALQEKADSTKNETNARNRGWRMAGLAAAAIGGGVLVGVTGGLAAPIIGGAVSAVFGVLGLGGTFVSLLASGLASSSVVCGALFGVYGARSTKAMVERHTQEITDLSVLPVREINNESLSVRLCVSGWLNEREDVWQPWTVFRGDNTFALQWEVEALTNVSNAMYKLISSKAVNYVKGEILRLTVLPAVMAAVMPAILLLNVPTMIDNPWMNARALAIKTGRVLGDLLAQRAFGNRPVSLSGFSLGALVIFEALQHLASLPVSQTLHLIHDVYLFGLPASGDPARWSRARRIVSGRLINGYSNKDYVLAVLSRASSASWSQAGMTPVTVSGVENVLCEQVDGHEMWRGLVGDCLRSDVKVSAEDIDEEEVNRQLKFISRKRELGERKETSSGEEIELENLKLETSNMEKVKSKSHPLALDDDSESDEEIHLFDSRK